MYFYYNNNSLRCPKLEIKYALNKGTYIDVKRRFIIIIKINIIKQEQIEGQKPKLLFHESQGVLMISIKKIDS